MWKLIFAIATSLVSGAAIAQPAMTPKQVAAFAAKARANLLEHLKDPASASFRNQFISLSEPMGEGKIVATLLCGEVNSKNSFGGYAGFARFYTIAVSPHIEKEDDEVFANMWKKMCSNKIADVK